ncbi:MAG TPA: phosphonate C-P lyase system protein PhnG [Aliiroseovarius sp.]|nr:phosphonate C-P lyase system protein PhnG [Aliiroseovarius sp.]
MTKTDPSLDTLARARPDPLKAFGESLIGALGQIEVIESRTGLVMLPMRDTAQGSAFHLGEVLVSQAHIRAGGVDGYGMRRGRDLEAAMAMALVDLALSLGVAPEACREFLAEETHAQKQADEKTLRRVEATRVKMETF